MNDDEIAAARQRSDALQERFLAFLVEGGVDLFYEEPEPDLDDYVKVFATDAFSQLSNADEQTRESYAIEAYMAAYEARLSRLTYSRILYTKAVALAALCSLIHEFGLMDGVDSADHLLQREQLRDKIVGDLWVDQLWCEPWISLVNQELPGEEPTPADIGRYEQLGVEQAALHEELARQVSALEQEMQIFLVEHGYLFEVADAPAVTMLASTCFKRAKMGDIRGITEPESLLKLPLVMGAHDPSHPVWLELISFFFPADTDDNSSEEG